MLEEAKIKKLIKQIRESSRVYKELKKESRRRKSERKG